MTGYFWEYLKNKKTPTGTIIDCSYLNIKIPHINGILHHKV
jgi:hypothetical protein